MVTYPILDTPTRLIVLEEIPAADGFLWVIWSHLRSGPPGQGLMAPPEGPGTELYRFREADKVRAVAIAARWAFANCHE